MIARIRGAWKAVVAAATPPVVQLVADVADLAQAQVPVIVTAAVSALLVYLVPNQET